MSWKFSFEGSHPYLFHYSDVTWAVLCPKLPTTQPLIKTVFFRLTSKKHQRSAVLVLSEGGSLESGGFPQRASNAESVSMSRRHPWWRHQMETFSALLAFCAGNSPVPGEFPAQRPVTRSFGVFFDLCPNNRWVNNREAGDLRRHRAHYDVTVIIISNTVVIFPQRMQEGWSGAGRLSINVLWAWLHEPRHGDQAAMRLQVLLVLLCEVQNLQ